MKSEILERFIRYVKVTTTSDIHGTACPSTDCQWDLLNMLKEELLSFGLKEVNLNENGYLIAVLPSNLKEKKPVIGFMAHVDTSSDVSGTNVKPIIHENYNGESIDFKNGVIIDSDKDDFLKKYKGDTIITSDGTTLLGADDKAGVAEIMSAIKYFVDNPNVAHGKIEIIFTPDEETGKGMDLFPVKSIESVFCYTMDGGEEGEIELECFNAYAVNIKFEGKVVHLGSAKGQLVNAVSMAASFVNMLPQAESPEATDGRFGYYCPFEINGGLGSAELLIYLRDFEMSEINRRIESLKSMASAIEEIFQGGKVVIECKKLYLNMREHMQKMPKGIEYLIKAADEAGVKTKSEIIRGGTDGARLSEMGIPTPNVFTGGHNFHSKKEWAALSSMEKSCKTIINLIKLWATAD